MYVKITSSEMVQRKSNDKKWQKCILCEHELCKNIFCHEIIHEEFYAKKTTHSQKKCKEFFSDCFHNKMPCAGLI